MLTRLPLLAASLFTFTAACADESITPPDRFGSRAPRPSTTEPGTRPEISEPPVCLEVDSGAVRFGTTGHDELRDVVVSPAGTILVAGFEQGTFTPHGLIGSRGTVLAYNGDLAGVERRAILDTTGTDSFESIAIAPDTQTAWLAARTNGEVSGVTGRGGFDLVVGDLRETGGFRPLARGFDSTPELARQLAVASGGFLAVAGDETRVMPDNAIWTNPFLAAFTTGDAGVEPLWFTTRRQPASERYRAVDASSHAVVVGGSIADGEEQGMFVATFDRDAGAGWRRQLSDFGLDVITAVKFLEDGDVVFAGTTRRQLGEAQLGGDDIVIGRLDGETGATRWIVQHGTASDDRAADLVLDADGRIYMAGARATQELGAPTEHDAFLLVVDAGGGIVAEEAWTSPGDDRPTAVAVDGCGAVVIAGHTNGDLAGTPRGGRDGFVLVTRFAE